MKRCHTHHDQPTCRPVFGHCYRPVWGGCRACGDRVDIQWLPDAYGANWANGYQVGWVESVCIHHADKEVKAQWGWYRARYTNPDYLPPPPRTDPAPELGPICQYHVNGCFCT